MTLIDCGPAACDDGELFESLPSEESVVPMSRLRRQSHCETLLPIAAEILEIRSLLSAGVHAAVTHAQHELQAAIKSTAPPVLFTITYVGSLNIDGTMNGSPVHLDNVNFSGAFQNPSATVKVGAPAKITINQLIDQTIGGITINSVKGTIGGRVSDIHDFGGGVRGLNLPPNTHFTISLTVAGKNINLKASANSASLVAMDIDGGNLLQALFVKNLAITNPRGFTGTFQIEFADPLS
jgi:hypothetical protein